MAPKKPPATETTTPAKPRPLTIGVVIGRSIERLNALNDAEAAELSASPASIKARYAAKREALLGALDPAARNAVLAASQAMAPKPVENEQP